MDINLKNIHIDYSLCKILTTQGNSVGPLTGIIESLIPSVTLLPKREFFNAYD